MVTDGLPCLFPIRSQSNLKLTLPCSFFPQVTLTPLLRTIFTGQL